jgi:hypothetical protein
MIYDSETAQRDLSLLFNSLKPTFCKLLEVKYNEVYNDEKIDNIISTYNGDILKYCSDINKLYEELYHYQHNNH